MKYKLKGKFEGLEVVSLGGVEWKKDNLNFTAELDEAKVKELADYSASIEKVRVKKSK